MKFLSEKSTLCATRFRNLFYDLVRSAPMYRTFANALVIGREHVPREGGFLLAANHASYYDVMCLTKECPRRIRWITLTEIARTPVLGRFVKAMRAIPVDRAHTGAATLRRLVRVLRAGEIVGIFPEAELREISTSVLTGGEFNAGVLRMALMARAPIVPVAIMDAKRFHSPTAWLPFRRTPYAVLFSEPIFPRFELENPEADLRQRLASAYRGLYQQVLEHPTYQTDMR